MKRYVFMAVLAAATATAAWADDVTVKDTPVYNGSQVVGLDGLKLEFKVSGNKLSKGLDDVVIIAITGQESFNTAEKQFADGEFAKAAKSYSTALDRAGDDWIKKLITLRRLRALSRVGPADQAVKDWLDAVAEHGTAAASLAPRKLGDKGSDVNQQAIKLLKAASEKRKGEELKLVNGVLLKFCEVEGLKDEIERLKGSGATSQETAAPVSLTPADAVAALKEANGLLKSDPKKAYETIREKLEAFPAADLAEALMLSAKAQQAMAAKTSNEAERKKLLAAAGLDFMRVAVFYTGGEQGPEALLQAGHCCRQLGNNVAAKNVYDTLKEHFAESEQAKKAQAALSEMVLTGQQ